MDDSEAKNITEYRKTVCSITVQPNLPTRKTHSTCDDCVYKNGLKRIDIPSYCANLKEVVMKHYWVRDLVEVRKYNGELRKHERKTNNIPPFYIRFRRFELQALGAARFADSWLRNDFNSSKSRQKREEIEALLKREYNKIQYEEENKTHVTNSSMDKTINKNFKYDIKLRDFEDFLKPYIPKGDHDWNEKINAALEALKERAEQLKKGTRQHEMDTILYTFRFLQIAWGMELNLRRTFVQKKSPAGKAQTAVYKATEESLDPLFTKLRNHNLSTDIAEHLADMTRCMLVDRNYVTATDCYMRLAIGNSPWPLGITMTQIHVRPGHEKIKAKNINHVFNDEYQRRFIQATKRLMTFGQRIWPCDPSKCVEFNGARPEYDLLAASSVDNMTAPVVFDMSIM